MKTIFYKYPCGCIGIPIRPGSALIVKPCELRDSDDYSCYIDDNMKDTHLRSPVPNEEEIIMEIRCLIYDGYRMRDMARAIDYINTRKKP